jgi:glutamate-1-semialdehyde 2,1-aminomutase
MTHSTHSSAELFARAQRIIPGGVNSPARAFNGVGGTPVFIDRGEGAYLIDVAGKRYIDYIGSWGPLILGHNDPRVIDAVTQAMHKGMSFGAPTLLEIELAEQVIACMPTIERIRMVNSGTEATMTAIRIARGFTHRPKIIKFAGCYHGHTDSLLVKAGSGVLTAGLPSSLGILPELAANTLVAEYNNLAQTAELFANHPDQIAGVIVEPIAGNMGMVLPTEGFLSGLRALCDRHGALLILDEVMTGFRVALGGAQAIYDIKPDLTTLGKIIGGGLPAGAVGGRADVMACLAPEGGVYQAGTLSGNPMAMAAGLATLHAIQAPDFHAKLAAQAALLMDGLALRAAAHGIPFQSVSMGGMFGFFFTETSPVRNFNDVMTANVPLFQRFYHLMLQQGVYFAPSSFESGFISVMHQQAELETTWAAADRAFAECVADTL